jgi:glucan phosphorylase
MKFEMLQCRNSNVLLKQQSFNTGDYVNAILSKQRAETISNVLYPDDRTYQGKELRLKQQYFFVSASLQDIMRRFKDHHSTFDNFADKVAVQLNDTHPTIGVPELMRLLVDVEGLQWAKAWDITTKVFSITIHSVVAETLEKWSVELLQTLLPRHLQVSFVSRNFTCHFKMDKWPRIMSLQHHFPLYTLSDRYLWCCGSDHLQNQCNVS